MSLLTRLKFVFRCPPSRVSFLSTCSGGLPLSTESSRSNASTVPPKFHPFVTIAAPVSVTSASLPTTWTFGGIANAANAGAVATSTKAVAWLNLLPSATHEEFPNASLSALGLVVSAVGLAVPHGLTLAAAAAIVTTTAAFPPGPLVVQCATGNRASAACAVVAAARMGWGVKEVFAWARAERLPFLGTQPLRDWVTISVQARLLNTPTVPLPYNNSFVLRQLFHRDSSTCACEPTRSVKFDARSVKREPES